MAKKLRKMRIDAIGLVDKGANQDAMIVIAKRHIIKDGADEGPPCPIDGEDHKKSEHEAAMKAKSMKKEASMDTQATEALQKEIADLKVERDRATKELADLKGSGTLSSDTETLKRQYDATQQELEKTRDDLRKQLEASQKEADAMKAENEKIFKQRRRERFVKRAADLKYLPGAPADDFAEFLDDVEKSIGEKRFTKFLNQLDAWNTNLEKSYVFKELGAGGGGEYSLAGPEAQLDLMAKELAAKDTKLSYHQAYNKVLDTPEGRAIYKRHVAETRNRNQER